MVTNSSEELALVWGAEAIAKVLGTTRRRAFHLLESGEVPAQKIGGRWVVERGALLEHFRRPVKSADR